MSEVEPPSFCTEIFNVNAFLPSDTLTLEEAKKRFVEQSTLLNVDTTSISSMIQTLIEKIDNLQPSST